MRFGLRSRAAQRVITAAAAVVQPAASEPPKDEENKPGAATPEDEPEASDEELDENGESIKKPEDQTGAAAQPAPPAAAGLKGNERIEAILTHPAAAGQHDAAMFMALKTDIDATVATTILGKVKAPTTAAGAPAAVAKPAKSQAEAHFLAAMKATGNPKTPAASAPKPADGSPEAAVTGLVSTFKKFGLSR